MYLRLGGDTGSTEMLQAQRSHMMIKDVSGVTAWDRKLWGLRVPQDDVESRGAVRSTGDAGA